MAQLSVTYTWLKNMFSVTYTWLNSLSRRVQLSVTPSHTGRQWLSRKIQFHEYVRNALFSTIYIIYTTQEYVTYDSAACHVRLNWLSHRAQLYVTYIWLNYMPVNKVRHIAVKWLPYHWSVHYLDIMLILSWYYVDNGATMSMPQSTSLKREIIFYCHS